MEYISSDTNIWIDYMAIGKLDLPFRLPLTYLMNQDAVNDELLSPRGLKDQLIKLGLVSTELTGNEFFYGIEISQNHSKLSKYDCSALAIAKKRNIVLLTGDAELRKVARSEGVTVMGTIGILDRAFEDEVITQEEYKESLIKLKAVNGREVRLPSQELQERLDRLDDDKTGKG